VYLLPDRRPKAVDVITVADVVGVLLVTTPITELAPRRFAEAVGSIVYIGKGNYEDVILEAGEVDLIGVSRE
jgi:hypothetical protein